MRRIAGPAQPLPRPRHRRPNTNIQNSVAIAHPISATAAMTIPPRTMRAVWPRSAKRASDTWAMNPAKNPAAAIAPTWASLKPYVSRRSASSARIEPYPRDSAPVMMK
jgi:hypothetical protein